MQPHPFPKGNYSRDQAITYVVFSFIKLFKVLRKEVPQIEITFNLENNYLTRTLHQISLTS